MTAIYVSLGIVIGAVAFELLRYLVRWVRGKVD